MESGLPLSGVPDSQLLEFLRHNAMAGQHASPVAFSIIAASCNREECKLSSIAMPSGPCIASSRSEMLAIGNNAQAYFSRGTAAAKCGCDPYLGNLRHGKRHQLSVPWPGRCKKLLIDLLHKRFSHGWNDLALCAPIFLAERAHVHARIAAVVLHMYIALEATCWLQP